MSRRQRRLHALVWLVLAPLALAAAWYAQDGRQDFPITEQEQGE